MEKKSRFIAPRRKRKALYTLENIQPGILIQAEAFVTRFGKVSQQESLYLWDIFKKNINVWIISFKYSEDFLKHKFRNCPNINIEYFKTIQDARTWLVAFPEIRVGFFKTLEIGSLVMSNFRRFSWPCIFEEIHHEI